MRLLGLFALPLLLCAQTRPALVPVPAGTTRQIVLQIATQPVVEDGIYFDISTKRLNIVLVTPDGVRVTQATARQAGFDWYDSDVQPAIGSSDAGAIGAMHFARAGRAGTYIVEFTAPAGVQNAMASASFLAEADKHSAIMSQAPGYQKVGPYALTPGQNPLEIVLDRDEQAGVFDLLTPAGGQLSLTLPSGQTIDRSVGEQKTVSWKTAAREKIDPPGAMFGIGGFLLPDPGIHHVVTFENAPKGKYQVRAVGAPVQVTAAFIPLGRIFKDATDDLTAAPTQAPAGQTRLQPYSLPDQDAKVGDQISAAIGIAGEPLSNPQFVVLMEYRQIVSREPLRYSAPVVEKVPTAFTLDSRGLYTGTVIPHRPGVLRVGVQVSGTRANGQPFSEETVLSEVNVSPVVARFLGLTEQAIDADKNGTLDRWEITAKLDVVVPGEYEMRLSVSGPSNAGALTGTLPSVRKTLTPGMQTLTAVVSAEHVRRDLYDGQWTIGPPQIFRPQGNTFGEFVAVPRTNLVSKAYKLDDFDAGAAHGTRTVTVRGIRPAPSGKFRFVELLWDVTTPGTKCNWHATLSSSDNFFSYQVFSGTLPAGRAPISFVYDSALFTSDPNRQWTFQPSLQCDRINVPEEKPLLIKLNVNASDYEPRKEPFLLIANLVRLSPAIYSSSPDLVAIGKGKEAVKFRILGQVPGLVLNPPTKAFQRGNDAVSDTFMAMTPAIAAGRYFIPIEAESAAGTATTELVVDVLK